MKKLFVGVTILALATYILLGDRVVPIVWLSMSYLKADRVAYIGNADIDVPQMWWVDESSQERVLLARVPPSRRSTVPLVYVSKVTGEELRNLQKRFGGECLDDVCSYIRRRGDVVDYVVYLSEYELMVLGAGYIESELLYVDEIVGAIISGSGSSGTGSTQR